MTSRDRINPILRIPIKMARKTKELKFDGAFLDAMRGRNLMTLQELANEIGASKSYVWELCQGRTEPSFMIAFKLAKALGVDMKLFAIEVEKETAS